ncbi:hypothetical protein A3B21_04760 [Candidatus Uhrbacteria bacterium RIFCSPLOWO2_01_FULL_47_24]|uniref:tRNA N6-adenosine threonylcarbamoyltransferase n=1 Tax=Candidatus Uhrbacteria bacterium RIFCSPLOWO2_01_FULL_47_24 TaxID=1802401 RepID=A0A1F7UUM4_9BACT|nr:MAG: hypothetical protein A3D58_03145 [Candidatus Uhrbacteria bacterium RIFCSPHIGHO2_02_FULL_46_47]OGL76917.1 MAG: hypothetical protein A3F52_00540 [Candidatus Uhrbacteria bacterium RIFCSPHIGHO2_12_FULL_47_11]OGL82001.1 MAG: hypothetical protein A3B21_04760 [Candidatus Uhrbacteria bacterium RIFCSPLOWO2_01_FULL_47_24]OGL85395.1 MAG: hypothetical protein A3J03_04925 [Candidatus Uhrbacteria bacterium RIFCSPLOWO2_02_FULL_46_25]
MRILGIETSCDETAAAVVEVHRQQFTVHSNIVASQIKIHAKTGGVVPEVAARAHVEKIIPVVEQALKGVHPLLNPPPSRGRKKKEVPLPRWEGLGEGEIDAIAVTAGPGLATSLLVGVEVARTFSYLWRKPVVAVNHLAGHVYANWLPSPGLRPPSPTWGEGKPPQFSSPSGRGQGEGVQFPLLCLIVSGGHTELVLMKKHLDFKIIGATRDDAAGEAFDKVAKMLGLGYPGGPAISRLAEKFHPRQPPSPQPSPIKGEGIKENPPPLVGGVRGGGIHFPRPMIDSPDFDFSFSGLKTAVLYYVRDFLAKNKVGKNSAAASNLPQDALVRICASFEQAVVDVLVAKTVRAAKKYKVKTVLLGGGVAANKRLREQLANTIKSELPTTSYILPSLAYTTDNAAMIAAAGYFMARAKQFTPWQKLDVDPNWELGQKFRPLSR